MTEVRTKQCTEVADRPFPDGKFFGRDIGDRSRHASITNRVADAIHPLNSLLDRSYRVLLRVLWSGV